MTGLLDAYLDDRLTNWGRAMRFGTPRGRAMSYEGAYRSPQSPHWELPPITFRGRADVFDAYIVEIAWSTCGLFERILLRGHYCLLWVPPHTLRIACRDTGIVALVTEYDDRRLDAQDAITQALGRTDDQNRHILRSRVKASLDNLPVDNLSCY